MTVKVATSVATDALAARMDAVEAGQGAGVVGFADKATMDAALGYDADTVAYVTNDPTADNNGTYRKTGAAGAGSWVQASTDRVAAVESEVDDVRADIRSKVREGATGELLADGATELPIWGVVEKISGQYLAYLDDDGRLRNPPLDTLLDSYAGAVDVVDNDDAPYAFGIVDRRTGYYLAYVDAAGVWTVPEAAASPTPLDQVLVEVTAGQVAVYSRCSRSDPYLYVRWIFGRQSNVGAPEFDYWGFLSASVVSNQTGSWVVQYDAIADGVNDCVFQEATDGSGASIDDGGTRDDFTGGNHGNEYSLATDPQTLLIDGVAVDVATVADYTAGTVTLMARSKVLRSRSPQLDPDVDGEFVEVTKVWTIAPTRMVERLRAVFAEQFTGTAYFPLISVQDDNNGVDVTTQLVRSTPAGLDVIALPNDGTDPDGGETVVQGVDEVWMSGASGGVRIKMRELYTGPQASYPVAVPDAGTRSFFCKVIDAGYNKVYWTLGGPAGSYGAVSGNYRAAAGDVWDRQFEIEITTD